MIKTPFILATAGLTLAATRAPETWNVDESHSAVTFEVKHFFTPVRGSFDDYQVDLVYDAENPANSAVEARVAIASINTGNADRDAHLRSGDFFEADVHPYMTFRSTSVREEAPGQLVATGPLTIKGVTREVELPITVLGIQALPPEMQQMLGGVTRVASFQTETTVDRRDFGVGVGNWAATLVVGGEVKIKIAVEANQR
ncbi:MAG TPA: YceI family protein [Longimicrobiales bacterium]|nr:YceI family protein [Longimicrobiales bacterium]